MDTRLTTVDTLNDEVAARSPPQAAMGKASTSAAGPQPYETVQHHVGQEGVAYLTLYRPHKANALNTAMFAELPQVLAELDALQEVRVIVLQGAGKFFCAGIDLESLGMLMQQGDACEGRWREQSRRRIKHMQEAFTAIERCRKPVIAAIHGACIGGAIDMVTACDLRYCTDSTYFAVKEVDLAITADLGTLQRLPGIVGAGVARELALTGREFDGVEARSMGLVTKAFPTMEEMLLAVDSVAKDMARKSPLAVIGTKAILLHSRDHNVEDSLDYTATWNSAMLLSSDLTEALTANKARRTPRFAKL